VRISLVLQAVMHQGVCHQSDSDSCKLLGR